MSDATMIEALRAADNLLHIAHSAAGKLRAERTRGTVSHWHETDALIELHEAIGDWKRTYRHLYIAGYPKPEAAEQERKAK